MNVNDKFETVPSIHLRTREDLLAFLSDPFQEMAWPEKYNVRSDYVIEVLNRLALEAGGIWKTVYNARAKQVLSQDLFGIELSNEAAHRENDKLSTLIYNAQGFRRADVLKSLGFVVGTEEMLREALVKKMLVEGAGGTICVPREIRGSIYAMVPRSRTKHYPLGQPMRLITKAQAKAIEAARAAARRPDPDGCILIDLDMNAPLDLSTLAVA